MKMPTINDLLVKIGAVSDAWIRVAYGEVRTMRNDAIRNKPVLAYGLGYKGFICVIQLNDGTPRAHRVSLDQISYCGAASALYKEGISVCLNEIKTNRLFVERKVNEKALAEAISIREKKCEFVGIKTYACKPEHKYYRSKIINVVFKNKKGKFTLYRGYGEQEGKDIDTRDIHTLTRIGLSGYNYNDDDYYVESNSVPKDIEEKISMQLTAEAL